MVSFCLRRQQLRIVRAISSRLSSVVLNAPRESPVTREKFWRTIPFSYRYERTGCRLGNLAYARTITSLRVTGGSPIALIGRAVGAASGFRDNRCHICRNEMILRHPRGAAPRAAAFVDTFAARKSKVLKLRAESIASSAVILRRFA